MGKGECVFNDLWLQKKEYKEWLGRDPNGSNRQAYCRVCKKSFDVANMGESALKSHAHGSKHKKFLALKDKAASTQPTLTGFGFGDSSSQQPDSDASADPQASSSASAGPQSSSSESQNVASTSAVAYSRQSSIEESCTKNDILTAEIYWALFAMEKHHSYSSFEGLNEILTKMFPTCEVARKFACSETKARYLTTFGLGPHFLDHVGLVVLGFHQGQSYV